MSDWGPQSFEFIASNLRWMAESVATTPRGAIEYAVILAPLRPPKVVPTRTVKMIELYRSGKTLEEIGQLFNLTRERVRQLMTKAGVTRMAGGQTIKMFMKIPDRVIENKTRTDRASARVFAKWGISVHEYDELKGRYGPTNKSTHPIRRYLEQRRNARVRGIGWELTFGDWWRIWQESGHWEQRGRGKGYCMARWGDDGPYSAANVYICTVGENFSHSYLSGKRKNINHPLREFCRNGHRYTEGSFYLYKGQRNCKQCASASAKKYYLSKKTAALNA